MNRKLKALKQKFIVETAPKTAFIRGGRRASRVPPKTCVDRLEWLVAEAEATAKPSLTYSAADLVRIIGGSQSPIAVIRLSKADLLLLRGLLRWIAASQPSPEAAKL